MIGKAGRVAKYERMTLAELRATTRAFDDEMAIDQSRPLIGAERRGWAEARRRPGRPRKGAGVRVISVSVERGLLARSDALSRDLGISRASLVARGLEAMLAASRRA